MIFSRKTGMFHDLHRFGPGSETLCESFQIMLADFPRLEFSK